jgi:hypothetical protein
MPPEDGPRRNHRRRPLLVTHADWIEAVTDEAAVEAAKSIGALRKEVWLGSRLLATLNGDSGLQQVASDTVGPEVAD